MLPGRQRGFHAARGDRFPSQTGTAFPGRSVRDIRRTDDAAGARGHDVPLCLYARGGHDRLPGRFLSGKRAQRAGHPPGNAVGRHRFRRTVPAFRAARAGEQREPRRFAPGVPRPAGAARRRVADVRRHPRSEPLVSRKGQLPAVGCADQFAAGHRAHGPRPLRRGVDAARRCAALGGHSGPAGLHAPLGAHRRQPRLGRGLGRRTVAFPRGLRAGTGARPGVVQRPGQPRDADAHQGLRLLRRPGGGDENHGQLHRNQRDFELCRMRSAHRDGHRHGGQPRGGCDRGVQTLQLRRVLHRVAQNDRRPGTGVAVGRTGRHARHGRPRRAVRHPEGLFRAGAAGDGGAGSCDRRRILLSRRHRSPGREREFAGGDGRPARGKRPPLQPRRLHPQRLYRHVPRTTGRRFVRPRHRSEARPDRPVHNRIARQSRRDHGFPARSEPERMHRAGAATARHAVGKGPARHAVGGARRPSL